MTGCMRPSEVLVGARVAAQRVMCELELVALAEEHGERAVPVARRLRDRRHAPLEQRDRRLQLAFAILLAERRGDVLGRHAERAQPPADALGAPGVEPPTVIGEALREAGVVDEAAVGELGDDGAGVRGDDALPGEDSAQLELGPVAAVECAPGDRAGALEPLRRVGEPLACGLGPSAGAVHERLPATAGQAGSRTAGHHAAAAASAASSEPSVSSRSIGVTRSWPIPSEEEILY